MIVSTLPTALEQCVGLMLRRIVFMVLIHLNQPKERYHFSLTLCLQVSFYCPFQKAYAFSKIHFKEKYGINNYTSIELCQNWEREELPNREFLNLIVIVVFS